MYIPIKMQMTPETEALNFINEFGFGVIVSNDLSASHLPFLLETKNDKTILYTHFAKANNHWQILDGHECLVIFSGPHAYISPSWYAKHPAVPTWNYSAVHVKGNCHILDRNHTIEVVEKLVQKYEPQQLERRDIITESVVDKLSAAIVGLKIEVTHLEGKHKLGQHRSQDDQQGVYQALSMSKRLDDQQLAQYMKRNNLGTGE